MFTQSLPFASQSTSKLTNSSIFNSSSLLGHSFYLDLAWKSSSTELSKICSTASVPTKTVLIKNNKKWYIIPCAQLYSRSCTNFVVVFVVLLRKRLLGTERTSLVAMISCHSSPSLCRGQATTLNSVKRQASKRSLSLKSRADAQSRQRTSSFRWQSREHLHSNRGINQQFRSSRSELVLQEALLLIWTGLD